MCILYYNVLHIKYTYVKYIFYIYKYFTWGNIELSRKVITGQNILKSV